MNTRKFVELRAGLTVIAVLLLLGGCGGQPGSLPAGDAARFASEYKNVVKDNMFVYISAERLLKIFEKGYGVVFFGFPECPWCQAYAPLLENIAESTGVREVFYYNIREDRENDTELYKALVRYTKDGLYLDKNNNERLYVPDVYVVKKGSIVGHDNETSIVGDDTTPQDYWTEAKKEALADKLGQYIAELQADTGCDECG
jgi:thiol-disulfide isomerase/thioredoxin